MPLLSTFHRSVVRAALFGMAALVVNLLTASVAPPLFFFPLGNVLLFMCASAYGMAAAIVCSAIAILPPLIILNSDLLLTLRIVILCAALAYTASKSQAVDIVTTLIVWLFLILPLAGMLTYLDIDPVPSRTLLLAFVSDLVLVAISSTILLSPTVWNYLTGQLRHVPLPALLTHVMAALSTVFIGALFVMPSWGSSALVDFIEGRNSISVGLVLSLAITFAAFIGSRLARRIVREYGDAMNPGLLPNKRLMTFSGLSSDHWRRQKVAEEERTTVVKSPSGETNGSGSIPPVIPPENGVLAITRGKTITFLNRKFRRFADITTNEVIGKSLDQVGMNPAFARALTDIIEPTFERGPRTVEIRVHQLPSALRFFELSSQRADAVENSSMSDGPDSLIITARDITDRRTVERHLLEAKKVESLGSLVNGLAHAFNNAITAISGNASVARRSDKKSEADPLLDRIIETSHGAGVMVRQLLEFSSSHEHLMAADDLGSVIRERLNLFRKSVGEGFSIEFACPDEALPVVCDVHLITQALTNLILNAREAYASSTGAIEISLGREVIDEALAGMQSGARAGSFVRLRIRDRGTGMSPETLSRAFDPLYTTKSASGHTGLGLSIVFAIVRAHDGFLTAESHLEKGTTVTIYIPLADETLLTDAHRNGAGAPSEQSTELLRGKGEKILVVEDDAAVRSMVTMMLGMLGYGVFECSEGAEALLKIREEKVDLVLIDLVLPRLSGLDTIRQLQERQPLLRALLMTGYGISDDEAPLGVQVLHKPFDLETLSRKVRDALAAEPAPMSATS